MGRWEPLKYCQFTNLNGIKMAKKSTNISGNYPPTIAGTGEITIGAAVSVEDFPRLPGTHCTTVHGHLLNTQLFTLLRIIFPRTPVKYKPIYTFIHYLAWTPVKYTIIYNLTGYLPWIPVKYTAVDTFTDWRSWTPVKYTANYTFIHYFHGHQSNTQLFEWYIPIQTWHSIMLLHHYSTFFYCLDESF